MPNWVTTRLLVEGPKPDLDNFFDTMIINGEFTFEGILPMPPILKNTTKGTLSSIGLQLLHAVEQKLVEPPLLLFQSWIDKVKNGRSEPFYISAERYLEHNPEYREAAMLAVQAQNETGYQDWYEWSIHNWGTKWDAGSTELLLRSDVQIELEFNTAWSFPYPVFEALTEAFPTLTFSGWHIEECEDEETEFEYHKGTATA